MTYQDVLVIEMQHHYYYIYKYEIYIFIICLLWRCKPLSHHSCRICHLSRLISRLSEQIRIWFGIESLHRPPTAFIIQSLVYIYSDYDDGWHWFVSFILLISIVPSAREKHKSRRVWWKILRKFINTYLKKSWPYLELPYHSIDQPFVLKVKECTRNF